MNVFCVLLSINIHTKFWFTSVFQLQEDTSASMCHAEDVWKNIQNKILILPNSEIWWNTWRVYVFLVLLILRSKYPHNKPSTRVTWKNYNYYVFPLFPVTSHSNLYQQVGSVNYCHLHKKIHRYPSRVWVLFLF